MCPIYKVPSSLTTDPFCNAEARAAWSLRDRSRIALTRGGSRADGNQLPIATIRAEAVGPIGRGQLPLALQVKFAASLVLPVAFIDSSLRVWAKGASHVDDATFVDSGGGDGFGGLVLFAPAFERGEGVELIGAGAAAAMGHAGDHEKTKPVVLIRAHVFQDGLVIRDGIQGGDRAAGTSVAPTVIDEELAPARFEFRQVRVDGVDFFPVQECSFDVLFEVEAAPIPGGVLIGDVAEHVDVHAAGFGGAGWKAPAEFATEGEARVEEFASGIP